MAEFWKWKGDDDTGSGLVHYTGSETINISGTVTTSISGTITVVVSGTATVNFSGSGTVVVSGTSTVTFSGSETVNVSGNVTIDITGNLTITFTGSETVNISGTSTVTFSSSETVNVSGNVTVDITGNLTVAFSGSQTINVSGTSTVTFSGSETIVVSGTATVNFSGSGTVAVSGSVTLNSAMLDSASETVNIIDYVTGAFPTIEVEHRYIHEGLFFETSIQATLTAGGTYNIVITTPATLYMHYRASRISCSADKLTINIYEDCSVSSGEIVAAYNHNRIVTAIATMTIVKTANVTADGTLILQTFIGGGTSVGGHYSGDEGVRTNEWIFKQSTNYCLRLSNGGAGSNIVNVNQVWYEETKG